MKKVAAVLFAFILAFCLVGCNEKTADVKNDVSSVNTPSYDVDLTALSSTMVYSEVYNMMSTPDKYIGKSVKMKGSFSIYHDEKTDKYYFACIIADATACCSQGLEFVLEGEHVYPDDYPALGSEITVSGNFNTYTEDGKLYCHLEDAKML